MLKMWLWLIYWSLGPITLLAMSAVGDAVLKDFVNAVGFAPVYIAVVAYFLVPLIVARANARNNESEWNF